MTVSIRILGASIGLSILASAGCGDDGNLLGERKSSGGSGAESGSSSTGGAGNGGATGATAGSATGGANAGTSNHGGSSSGTAGSSSGAAGDAGSGGTAATGGGAGEATGGSAGTATGGGAGEATGGSAGTAATGGAAGAAGGPGKECVDRTCAESEACVAYRTVGGPAIPVPTEPGSCPPNTHPEGRNCLANFAYQCVAQPGCAVGHVDCTCGTCPATYFSCHVAGTAEWLDPDAELTCEQLAP